MNLSFMKLENEEITKIVWGSFKKYVRWGGDGGRSLKSKQKRTGGEGVLACVYVRFLNKNAKIFKMKFYIYSPVFPIDHSDSMKY